MQTNEAVALKIFKKKSMSLFALNSANYEHSIMKQFDHPNILKTKSYFEDTEYIIIVYELLSSDLRALLVELQAPLAEIQIKDGMPPTHIDCYMLLNKHKTQRSTEPAIEPSNH